MSFILMLKNWLIGRRTKKKNIYVISTPMRPVPLEHFLWAGKDLHKIVDSKGKFLGDG
jgi:antiviral helicase SKI2